MALLLKIYGYYYTTEGKNLFLDIAGIINKRYSNIMQKDSLFDVKLNIPHTDNVRKYSIKNRSVNPKIVYIYVDNEIVNGSPFTSFSSAHKALGLNPSSNTCNRYIDTNRLYKNKYIYTSKPIDRASRD